MTCAAPAGEQAAEHFRFVPGEQSERRVQPTDSQEKLPGYSQKIWGGALWSPSYFAGSWGGAPISIIRQHIEQQQTPD